MKLFSAVAARTQQCLQFTSVRIMLASGSVVGMVLAAGAGTQWH